MYVVIARRIVLVASLVVLVAGCAVSSPTTSPTPSSPPVTSSPSQVPPPSVEPSASLVATPTPSGWKAGGLMVLARLGARATLLKDGTILVVGNEACVAAGEPTDSQRAEVYDPAADRWSEVGSLNNERASPALVALPDGSAMVLGDSNQASEPYSSTKIYSPAQRSWSDGPLQIRAGATAAVTLPDGTVLAVGKGRAETLAPGSSAWRAVTAPPKTLLPDRLMLLANKSVLATGEADDGSGPVLLKFDVARNTWTEMDPPAVLRPQLAVLADSSVLAIGDDEGGSHVQRLDPRSGSWDDTAQMTTGRIRPQITLLPDGRVLVAGGAELKVENIEGGTAVQVGGPLDSIEIYDPTADAWTSGPRLLEPRQDGHAVTLADGSVVVFGGYGEVPDQPNPDTGTPGPCPTPLATTERLGPAS